MLVKNLSLKYLRLQENLQFSGQACAPVPYTCPDRRSNTTGCKSHLSDASRRLDDTGIQ